jgi:hypothetical protein
VVTKKRRRRQLARASAQRQQLRRAQRDARRRRVQIAIAAVLVALAIAALVAWIMAHPSDAGSAHAAGVEHGDYAGTAGAPTHATTSEGVR